VLLALSAAAVALIAVLAEIVSPRVRRRWAAKRDGERQAKPVLPDPDPGRELRAEHRARALLQSCVNEEEWEMYRDLGFLRVAGAPRPTGLGDGCAYLLYPHRPIVAYVPETRRLVGEYCVTFEDRDERHGSLPLPDSDDVLAKWMALTADEHRLISVANMHLPGRQVETEQVERDLQRLAQWEEARSRRLALLGTAPLTGH
jgi:hypothetical protein